MVQQTAPSGVQTYYFTTPEGQRTLLDSNLETILDFPSVVLNRIERFPLPDGNFYHRQDVQAYSAPGNSSIRFGELSAKELEQLKRNGIKGPEDVEIPWNVYREFRGSFKWPASRTDRLHQPPTFTSTIDDGQSVWHYLPELLDLGADGKPQHEFFIRLRKVSKEAMQGYIDTYLGRLEASVGQQVPRKNIQPPWEKQQPRVFITPTEYHLRFYDEKRRNGERITNIALSVLGNDVSWDGGTVAKIHYTPIRTKP